VKQEKSKQAVEKTLGEEPTVTMAEGEQQRHAGVFLPMPALVVHSGPSLGDYFPFPLEAERLHVGRARDMDFVLRHASVSRCHARFTLCCQDEDRWVEVTDLGSTNGTQLNGSELDGSKKLCDGDMLQVGEIALRFRLMDPAEHAFQDDIARRVESARTDPLTGLQTRRYLTDQLPALLQAYRANEQPFSILIVDLDHFKSVNDRYGHLMGDQVLCEVARVLEKAIREADTALRFGGEEFCIVLPGAPTEIAMRVGERVRRMICELQFEDSDGGNFSTSTSIGVAEIYPEEEIADWLERADRALYAAKEQGRNCVTLALEPGEGVLPETIRRADQSASTRGIEVLSSEDLDAELSGEGIDLRGSMADFARSFVRDSEPGQD